ncbi:MAG: ABC transporter ATP-binding protein [Eubacterium sp.]|nr:ABC transporter ATP-binding protein [Eubacterium sp.]
MSDTICDTICDTIYDNVLELQNLAVSFDTPDGETEAVRGVDLSVRKGEIVCIVGESGCGKTVLCKSVLHLLPRNSRIKHGRVIVCGQDITDCREKEMRKLRGPVMSMIFQDPLMTLNPTIPVGKQIMENICKHEKISREAAKKRAIEMLSMVRIDDAQNRFFLQPHFFSGGMRQRCVLAVALASHPKLLFADEATTALDVMVEAKILDLLLKICKDTGISIVFITHDLGAAARIADRIAVMYAGKIVELGTAEDIFYDPRHPYTWGLLSSLPSLAAETGKLCYIPGTPPSLTNPPPGDAFAVRNPYALAIDYEEMPPMFQITDTHFAATWLLDKRAPKTEAPIKLLSGERKWITTASSKFKI